MQEKTMTKQNGIVNNEPYSSGTDVYINVRDKTGKLFAKMSPDKKHLRIKRRDNYVDIYVNKYGRMQVIT